MFIPTSLNVKYRMELEGQDLKGSQSPGTVSEVKSSIVKENSLLFIIAEIVKLDSFRWSMAKGDVFKFLRLFLFNQTIA